MHPASIPALVAVVLGLGATSSDSFGNPTYRGLRNVVRSLHGN
jgi:hypothetical protein